MRLPEPTSRDLQRAESHARAVAERYGWSARIDDEIPTTWHLGGEHAGRRLEVSLGSPRLRRWGKRASTLWLQLTAHEATWLPTLGKLRPATRSVWQWREGLPGETPHLRVKHAELGTLEYLLLPEALHAQWLERAQAVLENLPAGVSWLSADDAHRQVRVDQFVDATPIEMLERLLAWDGMSP